MDSFDKTYLLSLVNQNMSTSDISLHLQSLCPNTRGLSERSVCRRLKELKVQRRGAVSDSEVDSAVIAAVEKLGPEAGRRYVKGFIDAQGDCRISENRIGCALSRMCPENHLRKLHAVARNVNPIPYRADYFGHRLHIDQNEKIVRFGVTHVACIDGYSGYIPAFAVMPVKNNVIIYDEIFRKTALEYGLWNQIVADKGREFYLTLAAQESLSSYRTDTSKDPYRQIKSTQNNRIERFWVEVNSRINYPIKEALLEMEERGQLNLVDDGHRFCCSTIACSIAEAGMNQLVLSRNHHRVEKRGIPHSLMLKAYHTSRIHPDLIPTPEAAVRSYTDNGGVLQLNSSFGVDPLFGNDDQIRRRQEVIERFQFSPAEIYGFTSNKQYGPLQQFLLEFIGATEN